MTHRLFAACCAGLAVLSVAGCTGGDDQARDSAVAVTAPSGAAAPSAVHDPAAPEAPPAETTAETTESSSAAPAPAAPAEYVTPGKLDALLVPVDVLDDLVGAKLGFEQQFTRPGAPAGGLGEKSGCAVLFGSNTATYGTDYTAFRRSSVRDGETSSQHFVAQEVASFADTAAAAKNFRDTFDKQALSACNDAVVHRQGDDDRITWKLNVTAVTDSNARWSLQQYSDGKPNGWVCDHDARTASNVEFAVTVCQFGNGAPAAAAIGDRIGSWIPQPVANTTGGAGR